MYVCTLGVQLVLQFATLNFMDASFYLFESSTVSYQMKVHVKRVILRGKLRRAIAQKATWYDDIDPCLADEVRSGCMEEAGPAGVDSNLLFENSDNMMELPIIKYDLKQVGNKTLDHRVT